MDQLAANGRYDANARTLTASAVVSSVPRWRRAAARLLQISPVEASVERRGFVIKNPAVGARLEQIGETFIAGYNAAVSGTCTADLVSVLQDRDPELVGFAFEGAGMGVQLLDVVSMTRRYRFREFCDGPAARHVYMLHVGAGWVLARAPFPINHQLRPLDPLLRWLAFDGYGFHCGYFDWQKSIGAHEVPRRLKGYARRAFDQGLGRALWFVCGAEVGVIAQTIAAFDEIRRADLWSGVGLAATYAGGVSRDHLSELFQLAKNYRTHLGQGAVFAAKARQRAGNETLHTHAACSIFCRATALQAAAIADEALVGLPLDGVYTSYEAWRARIRDRLSVSLAGM